MQQPHYGSIYSRRYDLDEEREDRRGLLAYYVERWRRAGRPEPVLEPMCGTGFFLTAFLEEGADIDGLDSSEHMLKLCQGKLDRMGRRAALYHQRLEEMDLPRKYALILVPDRSFSHLHDKAVAERGLLRLLEHLRPGGQLILDLSPPPLHEEFGAPGDISVWIDERARGEVVWNTAIWLRRDGGRVLRRCVKQELFRDGELVATELFDYNERFYDTEEFRGLLQAAGFEEIETEEYRGGEIGPYDTVVYSCRRRA